jgi:histidinol-phosphate aminotransferase
MAQTPDEIIRDDIRALAGYRVPDASGMVKLDAMENPYRLPEDVRKRIASVVADAELNRYPDFTAAALRKTLREAFDIPEEAALVLGNGSDEIIQLLVLATARPGACVLGLDPSFVMFRLIAAFCGVRYVTAPLGKDFALDVDRTLASLEEHKPGLVFIAYPNNPTGNLFDEAAIDRVVRAAPGLVVLDEAYHVFAGVSFMGKLREHSNLLVMRTLSKLGLAGLRLGFLAGSGEWLRQLDKIRLPYNVSVLTQLVAQEALKYRSLLEEQASAIKSERSRVLGELARIPGTTPYPSDANFILFRTTDADRAFSGLKDRGVLIKNFHGSHPALDSCLRVTVGTPAENDRFLAALRDVSQNATL